MNFEEQKSPIIIIINWVILSDNTYIVIESLKASFNTLKKDNSHHNHLETIPMIYFSVYLVLKFL